MVELSENFLLENFFTSFAGESENPPRHVDLNLVCAAKVLPIFADAPLYVEFFSLLCVDFLHPLILMLFLEEICRSQDCL